MKKKDVLKNLNGQNLSEAEKEKMANFLDKDQDSTLKDMAKYAKAEDFDEEGFWNNTKKIAKKAGKECIFQALKVYYLATDPDTPLPAKGVLFGALVYLGLPIDAIPDFIPVVGFSDDIGVLASALGVTFKYSKDEHGDKANDKLDEWF